MTLYPIWHTETRPTGFPLLGRADEVIGRVTSGYGTSRRFAAVQRCDRFEVERTYHLPRSLHPDPGPGMTATANAKALGLTIPDKLIALADEVTRVTRGMESVS
jgi:hypothetical protein